jgi:thioredoxin reductase (NADPH)
LRGYGEVRDWAAGDVLIREGEPSYDFFVILSGRVVVLDGYGTAAVRELAEGGPGDFVAELNFFTGERLYTTAVVRDAASLLAVRRAALVELMGTDPDLADVVMPTVFARRQWLSQHQAGMRIVGSRYSPDTARLREFAARNRLPHVWVDPDLDASGQALLDDAGLDPRAPAVFLRGGQVLADPTNAELAGTVGLSTAAEPSAVYDVIVVVAGPAGLAASVYASSEGLRVATVDALADGRAPPARNLWPHSGRRSSGNRPARADSPALEQNPRTPLRPACGAPPGAIPPRGRGTSSSRQHL